MINWGILSTGRIASTFANDLKHVEGANLLAVASRSQQSADNFAKAHDIPKAYATYEQLVKDENIDVIYVATPHNLHYENTLLCLDHGKHVLCEKPMAVNSTQLREMIDRAKSKDLFLMEAMWTYFLPAISKAQEWIANGDIGEVELIKADFGFLGDSDPKKRLFNPELAGGALLDIGIYPIAFSLLFAQSEIKHLHTTAHLGSTGIDEFGLTQVDFENGIKASLNYSITAEFESVAFIYGTKGFIKLPMFWQACEAVLHRYDGETEQFKDDRVTHGFNFETEHVNKMLLQGQIESSVLTFEKSLKFCEIMDDIRERIGLRYPFE